MSLSNWRRKDCDLFLRQIIITLLLQTALALLLAKPNHCRSWIYLRIKLSSMNALQSYLRIINAILWYFSVLALREPVLIWPYYFKLHLRPISQSQLYAPFGCPFVRLYPLTLLAPCLHHLSAIFFSCSSLVKYYIEVQRPAAGQSKIIHFHIGSFAQSAQVPYFFKVSNIERYFCFECVSVIHTLAYNRSAATIVQHLATSKKAIFILHLPNFLYSFLHGCASLSPT